MFAKILFTFFIVQSAISVYSQQLHFSNKELHLPDWPKKYVTEYNLRTKIPANLYNIAKKILDIKTGKHSESMEIINCTLVNLEQYYKDYPDSVYKNFIPAKCYEINWSDKSIGVDNYTFALMLDSYNQAVYMGFPNLFQLDEFDFLSLDSAKNMADRIILKDSAKYGAPEITLYSNFCENDLIWSFRYPAKTTTTENKSTGSEWPVTRIIEYSLRWHKKFKEDTFIYFEF